MFEAVILGIAIGAFFALLSVFGVAALIVRLAAKSIKAVL